MSSLERSETPDEVSLNSCSIQQSLRHISKLNYSHDHLQSMLIEAHNKAVVEALTAFCESSIGNVEVKQKHERELWSFFAKALEVIFLSLALPVPLYLSLYTFLPICQFAK